MNNETLLQVKNLHTHFQTGGGFFAEKTWLKAVNGISFDIHEGEVLSLVGESGCGKSTVGRTLTHLEPSTSGQALFKGRDILPMTSAFLSGFSISLGLILVIGAQNAFVLQQGLRREHMLVICLTCALSDTILMFTGVFAFDWIAVQIPALIPILRFGGAAFLAVYGLHSLYTALWVRRALTPANSPPVSRTTTVLKCLGLTWLNPHVYLDTVVLIGSLAVPFGPLKPAFAIGAAGASFLFFFTLGYASTRLSPLLARPVAWQVLDFGIGVFMLVIAMQLLWMGPLV